MAPENKLPRCSHCEKLIKDNQPSISCRSCLSWFHKGCSGLTNPEFNKQASLWSRAKETTWTCNPCLNAVKPSNQPSNTTHRRSIGPGAPSPTSVPGEDTGTPKSISLDDIMEKLLHIESQHTNLLSKYEDQVRINAELRSEIGEIKLKLQLSASGGGDEITTLSGAARQNREEEIVQEVVQRQTRMYNVMIFNFNLEEGIPETTQISTILSSNSGQQIVASNVVSFGKPNRNGCKPVKVTLAKTTDVAFLLKNRRHFADRHRIYIEADLSPAQLKQLQDTKEELRNRRSNGEEDLVLKFVRGIPTITSKNLTSQQSTSTMN